MCLHTFFKIAHIKKQINLLSDLGITLCIRLTSDGTCSFSSCHIYVSLTKGQRPSLKQYLKPSLLERFKGFVMGEKVMISNQFLDDYLKCLRLFRCFYEAGDTDICRSIENAKIFATEEIDLHFTTLSPSDVECITIFLTCSSHKEWREVNLTSCFIQDHGVRILQHGLTNCNVIITVLGLSWNGLTASSSSAITDLSVSCGIKVLRISGNEGVCDEFYSILTNPSSVIEELYMASVKLSCSGAIKLFAALGESKKLRVLRVTNNDFTDEAFDAIIMAMKKNTSLVAVSFNPFSREQAVLLVEALQQNNTLQWLHLPHYPRDVREMIKVSAEEVNRRRQSCGCEVTLEVYSWVYSYS